MLLTNANVLKSDFSGFEKLDILIKGERIEAVAACGALCDPQTYDLGGKYVLPGFIDIHIHGCAGADTGDATPEALETMSVYLASKGVTSFCPTSMTEAEESLTKIFANVAECAKNGLSGAYIRGINMEGPYISPSRKGAQCAEHIRLPDIGEVKRLNKAADGLIRLVDIAPETVGAEDFVRGMSGTLAVSMAHTDATYEQSREAFRWGIKHATHLFNAMSGMTHRLPGAVGAVFDASDVTAELICDGFHVNPAMLRIAFKQLGEDRVCVISDSMSAAGCPDGIYSLGGREVTVTDGHAFMPDGAIAASTANMNIEFRNLLKFGVPFRSAVKACTINPAREIGAQHETGSIEAGKYADLQITDGEYNVYAVIIKGKTSGGTI